MSKGKYCPEIVEAICNSIINLKGRVGSAKEAGINFDTFCTWMNEKPDFAEAVKKAEKQFEEKGKAVAIQSIFRHMDKNWQAAAWWLERKHSDTYGRVDKYKLSDADGKKLDTIQIVTISPEEYKKMQEKKENEQQK